MSDSDKTDSSHESGKNVIIWAWPTSTIIIWNNPVLPCEQRVLIELAINSGDFW
jgi:hypothetical protein